MFDALITLYAGGIGVFSYQGITTLTLARCALRLLSFHFPSFVMQNAIARSTTGLISIILHTIVVVSLSHQSPR